MMQSEKMQKRKTTSKGSKHKKLQGTKKERKHICICYHENH